MDSTFTYRLVVVPPAAVPRPTRWTAWLAQFVRAYRAVTPLYRVK